MERGVRIVCLIFACIALACGARHSGWDPPADDAGPSAEPTPAARGAGFVHARGCAGCHGAGDGGVLAGQTSPRPGTSAYGANLTPDRATGIGAWTEQAIVRAMRAGFDDEGKPLCATMPRFSDMTDDEATDIVAYLRSLRPVHREIPESACGE